MRLSVICASTALAVTALSGTASASGPGTGLPPHGGPNTVQFCADGNYRAEFQLPQQGTTVEVPQGSCSGIIHLGSSTTYAKVYGFWNTHPDQKFWVDQAQGLRDSDTVDVVAAGVTTQPVLLVGHQMP
ncbi:hypothetical protein ACWGJX_47525 [Streptomyces sp. NPDC054775]